MPYETRPIDPDDTSGSSGDEVREPPVFLCGNAKTNFTEREFPRRATRRSEPLHQEIKSGSVLVCSRFRSSVSSRGADGWQRPRRYGVARAAGHTSFHVGGQLRVLVQ